MAQPCGVLLITPESLEAFLCGKGSSVASVFAHTAFFVVDELHAFIGSERGKQLQSLLHRIERILDRTVPRIGLSATLGDMRLAAEFLRPGHAEQVAMVESRSSGDELLLQLRGYEEPLVVKAGAQDDEDENEDNEEASEPVCPAQVAAHLFKVLRGSNNLVFPNSRREVERYTHLLNQLCESIKVPGEFWPHHGNLSRELRHDTEAALKQKERPASAICTSTLELGIDIGAVKCVAQVGPPPSVASLRQRLGRSGRRKPEAAILRAYCIENALSDNASLATRLRLGTVQTTAMILLLLETWFEPPRVQGMHLSTLIQQLLSAIAQHNGATAQHLYRLLCSPKTPFAGISTAEFASLLDHLGHKELLIQDSSGALLHGPVGEKIVNHHTFYAAFMADEEFQIVAGAKTLGSLPVMLMLTVGQRIVFAGKTWQVERVDERKKIIEVTQASGGVPPLFASSGARTHTRVRQRMRELLQSQEVPAFLDETAKRFLAEARDGYRHMNLSRQIFLDQGTEMMLLTWLGDSANQAVACLLIERGFTAAPSGPGVEVRMGKRTTQEVLAALAGAAQREAPSLDLLLQNVQNLRREKWDWALPDALLRKAYASQHLDLDQALEWIRTAVR